MGRIGKVGIPMAMVTPWLRRAYADAFFIRLVRGTWRDRKDDALAAAIRGKPDPIALIRRDAANMLPCGDSGHFPGGVLRKRARIRPWHRHAGVFAPIH